MVKEVRLWYKLKCKYFRQFWSYIEWGLIISAWVALGIYIWRYREINRIGELFKVSNGDVYINLQLIAYATDMFTSILGFSCFFATLKFLSFSRYDRRLSLFGETLRHASRDLLSFGLSFSIMLLAFMILFYLLFMSKIWACANLLHTAQMLFEMILMKFDSSELNSADAILGPLCFTAFIFFIVFIGITIFITIISDGFRKARLQLSQSINDEQEMLLYIWYKFKIWIGKQYSIF